MFRYEGKFHVICRKFTTNDKGEKVLRKAIVGEIDARSRKAAKKLAILHFSKDADVGKPTVKYDKASGVVARARRMLSSRRNMSSGKKSPDTHAEDKKDALASEGRAKTSQIRAKRKNASKQVKKSRSANRRGA